MFAFIYFNLVCEKIVKVKAIAIEMVLIYMCSAASKLPHSDNRKLGNKLNSGRSTLCYSTNFERGLIMRAHFKHVRILLNLSDEGPNHGVYLPSYTVE